MDGQVNGRTQRAIMERESCDRAYSLRLRPAVRLRWPRRAKSEDDDIVKRAAFEDVGKSYPTCCATAFFARSCTLGVSIVSVVWKGSGWISVTSLTLSTISPSPFNGSSKCRSSSEKHRMSADRRDGMSGNAPVTSSCANTNGLRDARESRMPSLNMVLPAPPVVLCSVPPQYRPSTLTSPTVW